MGENSNSSNEKNSIMLSRNTPVALVVGVAGFLGSHISEDLLDKNIQVVGIDNFKTGKREHLEECVKSKDFHLINQTADKIALDLPRLDYIFIVADKGWDLGAVLELFKEHSSKLVFVSHIDLYEKEIPKKLEWFQKAESQVAKFAQDNKLNARVVRLAAVFGPRMQFEEDDPIIETLLPAVRGQKISDISHKDFCTRALYIDNAVKLVVKSVLSGSTALKIFDGVALNPVKVEEVKLLINSGINNSTQLSPLPSWPTPNLAKTIKFLAWNPEFDLAKSLHLTLEYFKNHSFEELQEVNELLEQLEPKIEKPQKEIKTEQPQKSAKVPAWVITREDVHEVSSQKSLWSRLKGTTLIALILISYALVWPAAELAWGGYLLKQHLSLTSEYLANGEFEKSLTSVQQAKEGLFKLNQQLSDLEILRRITVLNNLLKEADKIVYLADLSIEASENVVNGTANLGKGLSAVVGEGVNPEIYFGQAQMEYYSADEKLSQAQALFAKEEIGKYFPGYLKNELTIVQERINSYKKLVEQGRVVAEILPEISAVRGKKSYLVLLQNNTELRPTGGFISSFAKVEFENGKLVKVDVNDINSIDELLKIYVEPPKEIREDLGQENWYLRDSNWEPDFPTSARRAQWFYVRETGERVEGVIALDLILLEELLAYLGPLDLTGYNEAVTKESFSQQIITHSKQILTQNNGFVQNKSFITEVSNELVSKLTQTPTQTWPLISAAVIKSLEQKHLMFYFDDPKIFSYIENQNWAGEIPKIEQNVAIAGVSQINLASNESSASANVQGLALANLSSNEDFIYLVEANLGANKANYYIERQYDLETNITEEGEINHNLKITYTNRSPSNEWPAGKYKNRVRAYLPFGAQVSKVVIGAKDITKDAISFVDYGRSGFSFLIEIKPKTTGILEIVYQLPNKLNFDGSNKANYSLDVIKQAGTLKDPFNWRLIFPENYHLSFPKQHDLNSNQLDIQTNLEVDRRFEVELYKR